MSEFESGSVMMSLDIVDRTGFEIPEPLEYAVGANLLVTLNTVQQVLAATTGNPSATTRTAEFTVQRLKTTGLVEMLSKTAPYKVVVPPGLRPVLGPDTTENIQAGTLLIHRDCETPSDGYAERKISIVLGQLSKDVTFYL
jgi:hypothetical protein